MRFFRRKSSADSRPEPPRPRLGSAAESWLNRGTKAVRSLNGLSSRLESGPTAEQLSDIGAGADAALDQLRELAGQVAVVDAAIARIPSPDLAARRTRCQQELAAATDPETRARLQRTITDLDSQLATDARLRTNRERLLGQMQEAVLGLEGLLTRAEEAVVLAGGGFGPGPAEQIGRLSDELDGLRAGLTEINRLTGPGPQGELPPPPT